MIKFHHSSFGVPRIYIYSKCKLLFSNLGYTETTEYVPVSSYNNLVKFTGIITKNGNKVFSFKIRINSEKKYTLILYGINKVECIIKYRDMIKKCVSPGTAIMRTINNVPNSNISITNGIDQEPIVIIKTESICTKKEKNMKPSNITLGLQTFTISGITTTATADIVNGGIYTFFIDGTTSQSALPSIVLNNNPLLDCELRVNLDFQRYIGSWVAIAFFVNLSNVIAYNFFLISTGRKTMTHNTTGNGGIISFNWIVHDTDYENYSLNGSSDRSSLVILSRKKSLCPKIFKRLVRLAKKLGYDVSKLIENENI